MSSKSKTRLLSAASAFTIAAFVSPVMYAQEAETVQTEEDESKTLDTIIVRGIRGSLAQSVTDKRNADKIIDTINAEDIGKSTDQNIAEALNRISGISINTVDGEGSTISVRGANADQTVVTLNGSALGSTGFSQGVDLSAYSADILSKVEVVKTPSADDEEGSLAAVVNLQTRKPLDVDKNIRTATIQGRYNDLSDDADYKISGTMSQKFAEDKFGIIATLTHEERRIRRDQRFFENYNPFSSNLYTDQNGVQYGNQAALDAEAAEAAIDGRESVFAGVTGVDVGANPNANIVTGLAPTVSGYELFNNETERTGLDFSAQWAPTNKTDITFNLTYNKQETKNEMDAVYVTTSTLPGHIDGVQQPNLGLGPAFLDRSDFYDATLANLVGLDASITDPVLNNALQWTDPVQDWRILDADTRTWTTHLSRHAIGGTRASVNEYETENYLLGTELNHEFTDAFRMTLGASTSKSEQTPEQNIYLDASRTRTVGLWNLHHVPADILQPSGYDCASGECALVGGTTTPYLGNIVDLQASLLDLWDNVGRTGFNPDDLDSHTLNYIQSTVTEVSDEQSVAFADFDWDVDFGGITSFEFGGKFTKREKNVDNQSGTPAPGSEFISAISPFTGETLSLDPSQINLIQASLFASGLTNASGFLEGLDVPQDNITDGWQTFDPVAALAAVTDDARDFVTDGTQTRDTEYENFAAYLKTNFSYMDDRIRGDVGVRYVKTKVETSGFAGAVFAFDATGDRILDPILLNSMRNSDPANACPVLSETPSPLAFGMASEYWTGAGEDPTDTQLGQNYDLDAFVARNAAARVDGLCYDPLLEPGAIPDTFRGRYLVRYADLSTENGLDRASIASTDSYEYDIFLPNLNVSFAATDDLVARFSAYKTMSRPPIDDLRSGFRMTEGSVSAAAQGLGLYNTGSRLDLFSAQIDPLQATNFDLSLEWYFQKDALLSVNLFRKNIEDLIQKTETRMAIGDLRRIAADPDNASVDGLTFTDASGTITELLQASPDIANCMPRRILGESIIVNAEQNWLFSGDPALLCNEYNVIRRTNADEVEVNGVEFQYSQNYTFLPGVFSGLGVTANYTFSEGEYDDGLPVEGTPRDSYNATVYWQDGGHQMRLAYAGSSDVLEQSDFAAGSLWREGRDTLDFSAAYQLSDLLTLTFDASNLTDAPVRTYYTSRSLLLPDATGTNVVFDEGSAFDGATTSRTIDEYNTGRVFRLGVRAEF